MIDILLALLRTLYRVQRTESNLRGGPCKCPLERQLLMMCAGKHYAHKRGRAQSLSLVLLIFSSNCSSEQFNGEICHSLEREVACTQRLLAYTVFAFSHSIAVALLWDCNNNNNNNRTRSLVFVIVSLHCPALTEWMMMRLLAHY